MRSSLRRSVLAAVVAGLAVATTIPSAADPGHGSQGKGKAHGHGKAGETRAPHQLCTGQPGEVRTLTLDVHDPRATPQLVRDAGERNAAALRGEALALVAVPARASGLARPRGVVVFDHGYGHTMESWREHLTRTAESLGVVAVAPNYRGQDVPPPGQAVSSRGWRVAEGAEDTIAYARYFDRVCQPTGPNVVYGVSMGGNTSGLVVAARPTRTDGRTPLFDYWVDVEGATNVTETYLGASALAPANEFARNARDDIEAAFGGTPAQAPEVYAQRTVVHRTDDIARAGLKGVVVVHGLVDGLVTHDHSRQLQALLRARGVPVSMWTAVTRSEDREAGTTIDGYVLPKEATSPFSGHASEKSTNHDVGLAGFAALDRLYSHPFRCTETLFDGRTGTQQTTATGC
jgi:acetyl esterase/lipase